MLDLFDMKYGVAGICVLLTIFILIKVAEFAWQIKKDKDTASETDIKNLTIAVRENTASIKHLEMSFGEVQKMKKDVRRFYVAVKAIAGDKWPEIRDEILAEDEIRA